MLCLPVGLRSLARAQERPGHKPWGAGWKPRSGKGRFSCSHHTSASALMEQCPEADTALSTGVHLRGPRSNLHRSLSSIQNRWAGTEEQALKNRT